MVNATRAIYIAAGVLIAFLVLAVLINVFKSGAKLNEDYDEKISQEQLELFNSKFEVYNKNNNTISDIVSVANLAYSINKQYDYEELKSVIIDIEIANKDFCIVSSDGLNKNEIYIGKSSSINDSNKKDSSKKIDLYNLLEENVLDLKNKDRNTIGISSTPTITFDSDDKLSVTRLDTAKNETIYKFLFKCDKVEYNMQTGKVQKMKFKCEKNSEY